MLDTRHEELKAKNSSCSWESGEKREMMKQDGNSVETWVTQVAKEKSSRNVQPRTEEDVYNEMMSEIGANTGVELCDLAETIAVTEKFN